MHDSALGKLRKAKRDIVYNGAVGTSAFLGSTAKHMVKRAPEALVGYSLASSDPIVRNVGKLADMTFNSTNPMSAGVRAKLRGAFHNTDRVKHPKLRKALSIISRAHNRLMF